MEAKNRQHQHMNYGTNYVEGNAARKLYAVPERREEQYERPSPRIQERRQPRVLTGMDFATLLVLVIAIAATLYVCVDFLELQFDVNKMEREISSMEQQLSNMVNENNAAYDQINTTYDLEYVYEMAVGELGMVYPNNNKVITYEGSNEDYVRQYADIPD